MRPGVFAFVVGALAMQMAGPWLSIPSYRLRFATLAAAVFAGAFFLLRPGHFVVDARLGHIESSLGWRSLLAWHRVIPFADVQRVCSIEADEDERTVHLELASGENLVVVSDLDVAQTERLGRTLAALIRVPFEALGPHE